MSPLPGYDDWKTHNPDDDRCEFCGANDHMAKIMRAAMAKALHRIDQPRDCGCRPCTGQCTSREALLIEIDEIKDIARSAYKRAMEG